MANKQAEVIFKAKTSEFDASIKQSKQNLSVLRSELKLNQTQLKGTGDSTELLKKRIAILSDEFWAAKEKTEAIRGKLEEAKRLFGENSNEAQRLARELNEAKNSETAIGNEIAQVTAKVDAQEAALSKTTPSWKKNVDAVEKADTQLALLNQELDLNAAKMESVSNKTKLLKERKKLLADEYRNSTEKVKELEKAMDACGVEIGGNSDEFRELRDSLYDARIEQEKIRAEIKNTSKELKEQKNAAQVAGENIQEFSKKVTDAGKKVSVISGATGAAGVAVVKSAIKFESAFAGVKKTTDEVYDANGKCVYSYKDLEDGIRNMAKEIPASTTEISAVAEAAGQLGIKTQDILGFTRVMIDMGNSTNLSSDVAAEAIAKFTNITGLAADQSMSASEKYGKIGSTIVDLGNNFATTENDIMNMATNLASAGTQVGMTEPQIFALATALSSVGMEAQAGGTAFSRVMIDMQLAVETNSERLKDFASVAGMSTSEFSRAFKEDAAGALQAFIEGLSQAGGESESAIKILNDMEIKETRVRDALLRSAGASDVFSSAMEVGKNAWEENNALTEEASKRYETTESKIETTKNQVVDIGIQLGSILLPIIGDALGKIQELAEKFGSLSKGQQETILIIGAVITVLGPALMMIGQIGSGIGMLIKVIGLIATPVGAAVAAIGICIGIGVALYKNWDTIKEKGTALKDAIGTRWNELKKNTSESWETLKKNTREKWNDIQKNLTESSNESYKGVSENVESLKNSAIEKYESLKNKIGSILQNTGSVVSQRLDSMKSTYEAHGGGINGVMAVAMEGMKENLHGKLALIDSLTGGKLSEIAGKFKSNMDTAKNTVKNAIDKIKSFFNFSWSLPKLKMPKISISGKFSINPPSVPKFSISWHREGFIMTKPTLMGTQGNIAHVGGEHGWEALLPVEKLQGFFDTAIERAVRYVSNNDTMLQILRTVKEIQEKDIAFYVNGEKFASATAGNMDAANGMREVLRERGLAL